jgi:hypothetical protein
MAQAHCLLDALGYKHMLKIYNTCFSTATIFTFIRLIVTLYVHCMLYFHGLAMMFVQDVSCLLRHLLVRTSVYQVT